MPLSFVLWFEGLSQRTIEEPEKEGHSHPRPRLGEKSASKLPQVALNSLNCWQASGSHRLLAGGANVLPPELLHRVTHNMAALSKKERVRDGERRKVLCFDFLCAPKIHMLKSNAQDDVIRR